VPFGAEDAERAEELADGAVRMAACATAGKLATPALDALEIVALRPAGREPGRRVRDRAEAEHARSALGRRLAGHVVHDPARRADPAAIVAEEGNDARAERAACRAQGDRVERRVPGTLGREPSAEIAAEQDCLTIAGGGSRAGLRG